MTAFSLFARKIGLLMICMVPMLAMDNMALAAEEPASWRSTYDLVMIWVNFTILVVVLYKFGREPIKNFLLGKQSDVAGEINHLEKQKDDLRMQAEETLRNLESSKIHFKEISEKIIVAGEKAKQTIIEDAKNQSLLMLEDAKRKVETQIAAAKKDFRSELIDASVDLALKKIGTHVTPEDDKRLIEQYLMAVPKNTRV
jgi:F-type H+-transporting ATPase subunit b